MNYKKFQNTVWNYYRKHGRHDLPWRKNLSPYRVFLSEIMLQQTQALRVIPKYEEWLKQFPNFKQLAQVSLSDVLRAWQGLGYNRRALSLKQIAEIVTNKHKGRLPNQKDELLALPGIGPYTAGALRVFIWNLPEVIIETNIRSVFLHHFFPKHTNIPDHSILELVEQTLDKENPREWYWALMDYGAHLKNTTSNPSRRARAYATQSKFKGSNRELRANILRYILAHAPLTGNQIKKEFPDTRVVSILQDLDHEGFITHQNNLYILHS